MKNSLLNLGKTPMKLLRSIVLLGIGAVAFTASADPNAEDLINLQVKEAGVYEVTHADLLAEGLDLSGESVLRIAVFNQGEAQQIEVKGRTDTGQAISNEFGPGGSIRFIGETIDTLYTDTNVYTLRLDSDEADKRIAAQSIEIPRRVPWATSYLATRTYAPQNGYSFASPDAKEPWYAERVLALGKPSSVSMNLTLDDFAPGGNNGISGAKLNMKVWGATDLVGPGDDHRVRVRFNGAPVIDESFDGIVKKELSSSLSNLRAGSNNVTLELPLESGFAYEAVNMDSVSVSYPRSFIAEQDGLIFSSTLSKFRIRGFSDSDIQVYRRDQSGQISHLVQAKGSGNCSSTDPRCLVRFAGAGQLSDYFVVNKNSVKTPVFSLLPVADDILSGDAEYLIITHPDFIADAGEQDLLGGLANQLGQSFNSVDIVDVEQVYAQFGNHIFDPQAIRDYVKFAKENRNTTTLLLVGGDIYDYRGFENQDATSFIPSMYVSTGDVVNFAPVDAKYVDLDDDNIPDMPIGRLPVRTMSELATLLTKRTAFINRDYPRKALFGADGFDPQDQYSFQMDAESTQQEYFPNWSVETAYVDRDGVRGARSKIINAINGGVSLTSFFGHSSTAQWTFDGLFNGFDAANLNNANRPTIVTQWGCWNTYYVNPNEDSMGHRFMMEGNRGAVAVMGATTLTSAVHERALADLVFEQLSAGKPLGEAITIAKRAFAAERPDALDVILGWTLLGSPELTL